MPMLSYGPYTQTYTVSPTSATTRPYIFHYTKVAMPDEVCVLQGARFGTTAKVFLALVVDDRLTRRTQLTTNASTLHLNTDDCLEVTIPESYPRGLYAVWVQNGTQISSVVYLNKAHVWWAEFPEIHPNLAFRLFGFNMMLDGAAPAVWWDDGTNKIPGEILSGDPYKVMVKAPASLVPTTAYTLNFTNGYGGALGIFSLASPTILAEPVDTLGLGVPWAGDFDQFATVIANLAPVGGAADDRVSVNNAIDAATAAGGKLINLTGTDYYLKSFSISGADDLGFILKANVYIRGLKNADGTPGTTIHLAPAGPPAGTRYITFHFNTAAVMGLENLRIICDGTVQQNRQVRAGSSTAISKVVIKNCFIDGGGKGEGVLLLTRGNRDLVDGCTVKGALVSQEVLPLAVAGSETLEGLNYSAIRNSTIYFHRSLTAPVHSCIVEDNDYIYDGDIQASDGPNETEQRRMAGWLLDSHWVVYLNNRISQVGAMGIYHNDGEIMNWQAISDIRQQGNLTGVSATTLSDSTMAWTPAAYVGYSVYIASGLGYGQQRTIASNTATEITVPAWDITPAVGARYVIYKPAGRETLIQGNIFEDGWKWVYLHGGGERQIFAANEFHNACGIFAAANDQTDGFEPLFDCLFLDNVMYRDRIQAVTSPTDVHKVLAMMAIGIATTGSGVPTGVGVINCVVRGNKILASLPNHNYGGVPITPTMNDLAHDGYRASVDIGRSTEATVPWTTIGMVGVVFDKCMAVNLDQAYRMSTTGVRGLLVYKPVNTNVTEVIHAIL